MNPQIIQPNFDASRATPAQPVTRPIAYDPQPTSYQPKTLQSNQVFRQEAAAEITTVSRPVATVESRQRTVISGKDDGGNLLTHGKIIIGQQAK